MSSPPTIDVVKLKNMLEARQRQVEEMSRVLTDMDGKIAAEKKNLKDNLTFAEELDRRVKDKELELHEIQKEKEILFGKLQIAHKEAGKNRNAARTESTSFMTKVSSFFNFGSKKEDPNAKNFIETSSGLVSKTDQQQVAVSVNSSAQTGHIVTESKKNTSGATNTSRK